MAFETREELEKKAKQVKILSIIAGILASLLIGMYMAMPLIVTKF